MRKLTISEIMAKKREGKRLTMVTAYDYPTALLADRAGIDMILVGDSVGMVVLGYDSTVPVSMEEMILFTKAASKGVKRALLVADLPFLSYQVSKEDAIRNAGLLIKEGGADAVKLEGGKEMAGMVEAITKAGIPVMGHIGLTPQTAPSTTGYRVQGRDGASALRILEDAKALEKAGAFSLVLEMVTSEVAELVTKRASIPTIGIGSGRGCDGQVLVLHDLLGLYDRFTPKFAKRYAQLSTIIQKALEEFKRDVVEGRFPGEEHSFHMEKEELEGLLSALKEGA